MSHAPSSTHWKHRGELWLAGWLKRWYRLRPRDLEPAPAPVFTLHATGPSADGLHLCVEVEGSLRPAPGAAPVPLVGLGAAFVDLRSGAVTLLRTGLDPAEAIAALQKAARRQTFTLTHP